MTFSNVRNIRNVNHINAIILNAINDECDYVGDMEFSRCREMDRNKYLVRLDSEHKIDIHALILYLCGVGYLEYSDLGEEMIDADLIDWLIELPLLRWQSCANTME